MLRGPQKLIRLCSLAFFVAWHSAVLFGVRQEMLSRHACVGNNIVWGFWSSADEKNPSILRSNVYPRTL